MRLSTRSCGAHDASAHKCHAFIVDENVQPQTRANPPLWRTKSLKRSATAARLTIGADRPGRESHAWLCHVITACKILEPGSKSLLWQLVRNPSAEIERPVSNVPSVEKPRAAKQSSSPPNVTNASSCCASSSRAPFPATREDPARAEARCRVRRDTKESGRISGSSSYP